VLVAWWSTIEPSNDRDWQPDVAVVSYATINGDLITVHNIRNFEYRTESDFTPHTTIGLSTSVSWWRRHRCVLLDGAAVAHVFVSFAFNDGQHLAISIETRKERGEVTRRSQDFSSSTKSIMWWPTNAMSFAVRTNYRKDPPEDVYVYRVHAPLRIANGCCSTMFEAMNSLKDRPEFYNTLTTNCTTGIWKHSWVNAIT
jgi:hypothetical protein